MRKAWMAVPIVCLAIVVSVLILDSPPQPEAVAGLIADVPADLTPDETRHLLRKRYESKEPIRIYRNSARNAVGLAEKLRVEGFAVRNHPAFPVRPPIDWAADPYDDRNWRYQLNALYPAIVYIEAYHQSGEKVWFDSALELYLDWIEFNIELGRENDFKWYDMATGRRAMYMAVLLDHGLRKSYLSSEDFERLARAASEHIDQLHTKQRLAISNHGLFQVAGIAALCSAIPDFSKCEHALPYANEQFSRLFDLQFNSEGMHLEHSPEYHQLGLNVISGLVEMDWFHLADRQVDALQAARENLHWLIKPDITYPAIGDTGRTVYRSLRRFHPTLQFLVSGGKLGEQPPGGLRLFPETGYAFVRHYEDESSTEASAYLALTVAHHSIVHKHADPFSFVWFDIGRSLLVDSGKWGYDATPEREYVVSTRAHNTVEIDGQDDSIRKPPRVLPRLSGGEMSDLYVLRAQGKRQPSGLEQERTLVLKPGHWLIVADDFDSSHSRLAQWFHAHEDARCRKLRHHQTFQCVHDEKEYYVHALLPVSATEHERGKRSPRMQGWVSPRYHELIPNDAMAFVQEPGSASKFVTLFHLGEVESSLIQVVSASVSGDLVEACWTADGVLEGAMIRMQEGEFIVEACDAMHGIER